jgi:flagellar biosynthesis/type III secretory pathway chaperone
MKTIDRLEQVLTAEAELAELMRDILKTKQEAIVKFDSAALDSAIEREEELASSIEALERERTSLTKSAVNELEHRDEMVRIEDVRHRLREAVHNVIVMNSENDSLLKHSLRFVRENIRILTENYSRQLVDQKV